LPALLSDPNTTHYFWGYYAIMLYLFSPVPVIASSETLRGLSRSCDKVAALCSQPNIAPSSLIAGRRHPPPTKSTAILETEAERKQGEKENLHSNLEKEKKQY